MEQYKAQISSAPKTVPYRALSIADKQSTYRSPREVWCLSYPYFFSHDHVHQIPVKALRDNNMRANALAIVPRSLFKEHADRYEAVRRSGNRTILQVDRKENTNKRLAAFALSRLLLGKTPLFHVLLADARPIIRLKSMPILGRRLKLVMQYEGDDISQLVYWNNYSLGQRPSEIPNEADSHQCQLILRHQINEVRHSDGLVLMSNEHIQLWQTRLDSLPPTCILAPHVSPEHRFNYEARRLLRAKLCLEHRIVLIYTGNISCLWQRFEETCQFVSLLRGRMPRLYFLALVKRDDLEKARAILERHVELSGSFHVTTVPSGEVAGYLSAADVGLFLRHNHSMNRVVTSAKLGEYIGAGLPVITTGATSEVMNRFIGDRGAGLDVEDSLEIDHGLTERLASLVVRTSTPEWRSRLSSMAMDRFCGKDGPGEKYAEFIFRLFNLFPWS